MASDTLTKQQWISKCGQSPPEVLITCPEVRYCMAPDTLTKHQLASMKKPMISNQAGAQIRHRISGTES